MVQKHLPGKHVSTPLPQLYGNCSFIITIWGGLLILVEVSW